MSNNHKLTEHENNKNLLKKILENQEQILKRINDLENKNKYPLLNLNKLIC